VTGSIVADAPIWVQALSILWIAACAVAILHIVREARYRRDPYSHHVELIPTAHEGRLVPVEDDRDREWKDIA
jgi:hypothetical protein